MSEKNGSLLPRWTPDISLGQLMQAAVVAIGGVWVAFGVIGNLRDQLAVQASKIQVVETQFQAQLTVAADWKGELREQLKAVNDKLEMQNKTLSMIQLGLANKVDRRP